MSLFEAALLGIIQGLTEFLPISSSGHLVLCQKFLKTADAGSFIFDVALHTGTLIAVILYFKNEIRSLIKSFLKLASSPFQGGFAEALREPDIKLLLLIITASVPTAFIGFLLGSIAEKLFESAVITGIMLIITGIIIWLTKYIPHNSNNIDMEKFSFKKALLIGTVQGCAVIPGISRAGTTISAALFFGIESRLCAKFSFLLSIPAILGAQIISLTNFDYRIFPFEIIAAGAFTAFITGYIALILLMNIVKKGKLYYFAPYCWLIGILSILFISTGVK